MRQLSLIFMLVLSAMLLGNAREHKVERGETFSTIARRYGVSEEALRSANPRLKGCHVGYTLAIPDPPPPPKPKPAPKPVAQASPKPATQQSASQRTARQQSAQPQHNHQQSSAIPTGYVRCYFCAGKKYCIYCKGTGNPAVPPPPSLGYLPSYFHKCIFCGGTGVCQTCKGEGIITIQQSQYAAAFAETYQQERRQRSSSSSGLKYPEYQRNNDSRGNFSNSK